jgi:hypothetical protein
VTRHGAELLIAIVDDGELRWSWGLREKGEDL